MDRSSIGMNMYPMMVFEFDDGKSINSRFSEKKIEAIYKLFAKYSQFDIEKEKEQTIEKYDNLIKKYQRQIDIRDALTILCMFWVTSLLLFVVPLEKLRGETLDTGTKVILSIAGGLVIAFAIIMFFALIIGRGNYAKFKSLLLRRDIINTHFIKKDEVFLQLQTKRFEHYSRNTFRGAGIIMIVMGFASFLLALYSTSNVIWIIIVGLVLIVMGFGLLDFSGKKHDYKNQSENDKG